MEKEYVKVWQEKVTIPTYNIGKPDQNPMFFEKRVYQGSSGVVYPNPIIEHISDEKINKEYTGLFLENEYLKVMILPELGGRIQLAYDKTNERHFIYYNQVIKPALVGLTGPWISGGIEFNWPQHHRPSTFDAVDYKIEENADGSKTVWVNEIEQMFHTKGMAGFTLYPGKAYIEIKAKLFNRSSLPQTFLWWANPAVKVNDHYQSVFPPDVNAVFDHGKRDVSSFPIATGTYYKVDYAPGTDISWYKNIPVPTSYMAINSAYDFVGGYEHDRKAGLLHVANHHVSPGKKQWTWGHGDFGQAWDRNLTDEDGPYIELMTGMFTDNQPDFTWLLPNEEKSFTQYFLPYKELGLVKNATKDVLIAMNVLSGAVELKVYGTSIQHHIFIVLKHKGNTLFEDRISLNPAIAYQNTIPIDFEFDEKDLLFLVQNENGKELISYSSNNNKINAMPSPALPALLPKDVENNEQLFLTGQHLEQYRHATYGPVPYYTEALERDPNDYRCNNALGLWYLRRGKFAKSEPFFLKAIATITKRNPNPYDTESYYNLGVCYLFLDKTDKAYDAFYKATWSKTWKDIGFLALAQLDMCNKNYELALEHLDIAIDNNANNGKAYVLKAAAYRKLGMFQDSVVASKLALEKDPFNLTALYELAENFTKLKAETVADNALKEMVFLARDSAQNYIAYSLDYAAAGLFDEAISFLSYATDLPNVSPIVYYSLAYYQHQLGNPQKCIENLHLAEGSDSYLCFPNRLEEIKILQFAISKNSRDAKAPYYLGNLFYDKRQYDEAILYWEMSLKLDDNFATTYRNLGIAYFNKRNDAKKAFQHFEQAFNLNKTDARVLMEFDQLHKRLNYHPSERLKVLQDNLEIVYKRDDLYLEYISLINLSGDYSNSLKLLLERHFHPWEGGEGKASGQYVFSLIELAKNLIQKADFKGSIELLTKAQIYPVNLGEGKLHGKQENDIFFWLGCAYEGLKDFEQAKTHFQKATIGIDEPAVAMFYNDQQPDQIFYQGLAWSKLGKRENAVRIFSTLFNYGNNHLNDDIVLDYFAVSLPNLLTFEDDLNLRNYVHCKFMIALGLLGLGNNDEALNAFNEVLKLEAAHQGAKSHIIFNQLVIEQMTDTLSMSNRY